jgi:hypothetical protein
MIAAVLLAVAGMGTASAGGDSDPAIAAARCLVKDGSGRVWRALDGGLGKTFEEAVARLDVKRCLPKSSAGQLPSGLRGAMYAEMYRKFGPEAKWTPSSPVLDWVPQLRSSDPMLAAYKFSSCIIARNPEASRKFVLDEPGTDEAKQQLSALIPALQSCLPPGQTLRLSVNALTGLLAESLFHIDLGRIGND